MARNDEPRGFLARWSERKAEVRRTGFEPAEPVATDAPTRPDPQFEAGTAVVGTDQPGTPDAEAEPAFDPATLPDIETLTAESDVAAFLQKGVPADLQRLALRRIWSLDPAIRDFIEVAENQYDFNNPSSIPGFGELAPGTDIARLLAHAIGAPPPSELGGPPEPDAGARATPHNSLADVEKAPEPVEIADVRPTPEVDGVAGRSAEPAFAADAPQAPSAALVEPPPRRHGGALPA